MNSIIFDILISVCYLYYGYKFYKNPPEFGSTQGIATKYTKANTEAWVYGHKFAGIYCLVCGVVCVILTAIQYLVFKDKVPLAYMIPTYALEVIMLTLLIPATNLNVKKKFGNK